MVDLLFQNSILSTIRRAVRNLKTEARGGSDADLSASGEVDAVPTAALVFTGDADFGQRAADLDDVGRSDLDGVLLHVQYSSPF
jgi:hypothetical protein